MPRAVPRAIGAFLAIAVMIPAPLARAQAPSLQYQGKQMPMRKAVAQDNHARSDGQDRLDEMKVEFALLNDITTFPYSLGTSVRGELLELYGFVPDDTVRKRALELARHNSARTVKDSIGIRSDLAPRAAVRPAQVLRQEATELIQKNLREMAKQISLDARADGVIVLTGRTDSMESKLEISRLFRELSGCAGVDNKLTVEQIEQNGQRLVKVTRDGSLLVRSSALAMQPASVIASSPPPQKVELASFPDPAAVANQQPPSMQPQPAPLPTGSLQAKENAMRLPTAIVPKQASAQPKPAPENIGGTADALAPPKLPVKWGRPTGGWETQMSRLEAARGLPTSGRTSPVPHADFAEARTTSAPDMTWRQPGGNEESEPKSSPATIENDAPKSISAPAPSSPPLRSSRRWPPAYVTGKPASEGKPGIIIFDDDVPPSQNAPAVPVTRPSIVPSTLLSQVKSLCGRQARDVSVAPQQDGSLVVKVKVANRIIEDQLTRKILTIPEMRSPKVRLMMEVEP